MQAYRCDHCDASEDAGSTKNRRPDGWLSVRVIWNNATRKEEGEPAPAVSYDLCEECAKTMKKFLGRED